MSFCDRDRSEVAPKGSSLGGGKILLHEQRAGSGRVEELIVQLRVVGLMSVLALAGCATYEPPPPPPPPPPPSVAASQITIVAPYRAEDFAWSTAIGSARIHGVSPLGRSCAGRSVALTPETAYSRERIRKLYGSAEAASEPIERVRSRAIANDNPDMRRFVRVARCDASGSFLFEGLPAGSFFVIAEVTDPQGPQVVMRRVVTAAGRVVDLTLSAGPPLRGPR